MSISRYPLGHLPQIMAIVRIAALLFRYRLFHQFEYLQLLP